MSSCDSLSLSRLFWLRSPSDPCLNRLFLGVACINPPELNAENRLHPDWDGVPVEFGGHVTYKCETGVIPGVFDPDGNPLVSSFFFEHDSSKTELNVTCLKGGSFDTPYVWPKCVDSKSTGIFV